MGVMVLWPIVALVLVAMCAALYLLIRHVARSQGAQGIGILAMAVGFVCMLVPFFLPMGSGFDVTHVAIMLSGAVVFGCGTIATVIAARKE